MMRLVSCFLACSLAVLGGGLALAGDDPPSERWADVARRHGLDPTSALDSRVRATPAAVLKMFDEPGTPAPTPHALTEAERLKLKVAFAGLPPRHRRVLAERLRSVSFLDGMPNTALTSPANPDEPDRLFDITIRAAILNEDASRWLTWKERTIFDPAGSPLSVAVEAGSGEAIAYILLHEATHIVDFALHLTPDPRPTVPPGAVPPATPFTAGVWADRLVPAPPYREPLLQHLVFREGGKPLPIDQAEAAYEALGRTPFASLYGGSNCHDDLAESLALYHWTEVLKQPYRIVIRRHGAELAVHEPMKSALVRARFGQLRSFYDDPS